MRRPLFAVRLEAKRRSMGLSQEGLAEQLDVSPVTVFRWERGASLPDGKHINPLISTLGFEQSELAKLFEEWILNREVAKPRYAIRGYEYASTHFASWARFLDCLIEIDAKALPNLSMELEGTSEQWAPIFESNPYTWKVLTFNDIVIGYWHYIPLKESSFARAKSGELIEAQLSNEQVDFLVEPGNYRMFISMIVIEAAHRNPEATSILKDSFLKEVMDLARRGFFFSEICTCALSPVGIDLCRILGMERIGRHKHVGEREVSEIYYLSGSALPQRGIFKRNRKLAELYSRHFC